jgi:pilus assembly protein CpaB
MPLRLFLVGILLSTAIGLGLIGYQMTRPPVTLEGTIVPEPVSLSTDILVAAHSLPAGTLMKEDDFTKRAMSSAAVPPGALIDSAEVRGDLRGALLRHYLESGQTLVASDVLHTRDHGFLAAVLAPGARAISIGVDAITGNAGLIWPGDKVDMILTQALNEKDAPMARRFVGETVLDDVRVVAVDQSIARGSVAGGENIAGRLARTVTLEVTSQQAERAAVAERLGTVTLAIRAADGEAEVTGRRTSVYAGDVSAALTDGGMPTRMRMIEGKDVHEVTFQ